MTFRDGREIYFPDAYYAKNFAQGAPTEMVDAQGNKYDLTGKPAFSLCRCGGSVNKPFCDGMHRKSGFQSECLKAKDQP